ncbi:MAG: substrate-binding domain-containing protein [Alphaproteobacteria bacterium]|nr:substrate-binding domain-containing protein [Alphaproteobacteria bacterium]MCW5739567.1 substrate-binding domain-containing protein [Alphaproteobacteria bacterium]
MIRLRYLCDRSRHIVCLPYSVDNLHVMAQDLRLSRGWFHAGRWPHYDMPAHRIEELTARCEVVSPRVILSIIRTGSAESSSQRPAGDAGMAADIVVIMKNRVNPAYGGALVGAAKSAARFGLTLRSAAPAVPDDIDEQRMLIRQVVAARPSAIVLLPAHESALNDAIGEADALGIPVFHIVSKPMTSSWVNYVATDSVRMAGDIASHLFDHLGGSAEIVIMDGTPSAIASPERHKGFVDAAARYPGIRIVEAVCGYLLREPARAATQEVLRRHARIDGMLVANDMMALGVIDALGESGRTFPVASINGTPEAVAAIRSGTMLATASFDTLAFGELSVEAAARYLRGETVPREIMLPSTIIDQSNVDHWDRPYEERPVPTWEQTRAHWTGSIARPTT